MTDTQREQLEDAIRTLVLESSHPEDALLHVAYVAGVLLGEAGCPLDLALKSITLGHLTGVAGK